MDGRESVSSLKMSSGGNDSDQTAAVRPYAPVLELPSDALSLRQSESDFGHVSQSKISTDKIGKKGSTRSKSKMRKAKPWEDRAQKNATIGNNIRTTLPGIEAYDREFDYHAFAAPKVILRLERVVGTDHIRINDHRFMRNFAKKIEEEERTIWNKRVKMRQEIEKSRHRQLVIDGILEPQADMEDLRKHPIFRVNRMMRRINKFTYTPGHLQTPPPITPHEPFEEEKRTGFLFGWHKNHYLKVQRDIPPVTMSPPISPESLYNFDYHKKSKFTPSIPSRSNIEMSRAASIVYVPKISLTNSEIDNFEFDEEEEQSLRSSIASTNNLLPTESLAILIRRQSLSQARKYLGLEDEGLEKQFEIKPSSIVNALFDKSKEKADDMFDYSENLIGAYKREKCKTDEFVNKVHRKLFF